LVAALFALAAKDAKKGYAILAYLPVGVFWILDGYFLSEERLFRKLYEHVRNLEDAEVNFSMDAEAMEDNSTTWASAVLSRTLAPFYLSLLGIMLILMYVVT